MKFKYKGHNYNTDIVYAIRTRLGKHFGSYKVPASAWVEQHIDNCCDYWIPIDDPRAKRALMLDDDLGFSQFNTSKNESGGK